jgi:hypothetical protein
MLLRGVQVGAGLGEPLRRVSLVFAIALVFLRDTANADDATSSARLWIAPDFDAPLEEFK